MARLFGRNRVMLLGLAAVVGTILNLAPFFVHLEREMNSAKIGEGTLSCRPAPYGRAASVVWVRRYQFETDLWHYIRAAHRGDDAPYHPLEYTTVSYRKTTEREYQDAIESDGNIAFRLGGTRVAVALTTEKPQKTGQHKAEPATFYGYLTNPGDKNAAEKIFDYDVHLKVGGKTFLLSEFGRTVNSRILPMTNRDAARLMKEVRDAVAFCAGSDPTS